MSKRSRVDYEGNARRHDAAANPIDFTTGTFAESKYDRAGIRDTIAVADGKQPLYYIGRDPRAFDIEVEDPLFFVARSGGASTTQALVRSNAAGLGLDAQREYATRVFLCSARFLPIGATRAGRAGTRMTPSRRRWWRWR